MKWRRLKLRSIFCLLTILCCNAAARATTCAELSGEETREIAYEAIEGSFVNGLLFGLGFAISIATLYVLLRHRRFVVASFYGFCISVVFLLFWIANTYGRCISSGLEVSYFFELIVVLVIFFATSIVFRNWRLHQDKLTTISDSN